MRPMTAATAAAAALLLLAGCSSSPLLAPSGVAAEASASAAPTGEARPIEFTVKLTSTGTQLTKVGAQEEVTYGWNDLRGATTIDGQQVQVRLQGSVWYVGGQGPWGGFFTITYADGSVLGLRVVEAVASKSSDRLTEFRGTTVVMGGTGRFANASGRGTAVGSRDTAIGGEVAMTLSTLVAT